MRRILIFNSGVFVYGAEKCLISLISALEDDYEVFVILPRNGPLGDLLRQKKCKVLTYPLAVLSAADSPFWALNYLFRFFINLPSLALYALFLRCDCLVSNTLLLIPPVFASKICGKRFIWFVREFFPSNAVNRLAAFLARHFADIVVCMSRNIAVELFGGNAGISARIRVIHEPLPVMRSSENKVESLRRELNIHQDSVVVSLVARLHPSKGQLEFLRDYSFILKKHNVAVLLAGDPQLQSLRSRAYAFSLKQFIREAGLSDRVRLLGYRDDIADLLGLSDICVFPYLRNEPFGISFQEALAAEKLVLYYPSPGLEEVAKGFFTKEALYLNPGSLERSILNALSRRRKASQDVAEIALISENVYNQEMRNLFRGVTG